MGDAARIGLCWRRNGARRGRRAASNIGHRQGARNDQRRPERQPTGVDDGRVVNPFEYVA